MQAPKVSAFSQLDAELWTIAPSMPSMPTRQSIDEYCRYFAVEIGGTRTLGVWTWSVAELATQAWLRSGAASVSLGSVEAHRWPCDRTPTHWARTTPTPSSPAPTSLAPTCRWDSWTERSHFSNPRARRLSEP